MVPITQTLANVKTILIEWVEILIEQDLVGLIPDGSKWKLPCIMNIISRYEDKVSTGWLSANIHL